MYKIEPFIVLSSGAYVMVIGELTEVTMNQSLIEAIKIVDYLENEILQRMWPDEVEEAKQLLSLVEKE